MKTLTKSLIAVIAIAAVLGSTAFAAPAAVSDKDNWRVIKNAVQEDGRHEHARGEARWFKIVITDDDSRDEAVRITLPLSLVEGIARLASNHHSRSRHFDCDSDLDLDIDVDIDFEEVLAQLKKSGPLSLVEIRDDDALIKIWIE